MEKIKIFWTKNAQNNLLAIYSFISNDSEVYAEKFTERLVLICNRQLLVFPNSGRNVPEFRNTSVHFLKELIYRNYRVIYNYNTKLNKVSVLAIINAKMNLQKNLLPEL